MILGGLVMVVVLGGLIIIQYSMRIEGMILNILDKELAKYQITEKMETALVNQKGYVTYFYMDQDPSWLEQLWISPFSCWNPG